MQLFLSAKIDAFVLPFFFASDFFTAASMLSRCVHRFLACSFFLLLLCCDLVLYDFSGAEIEYILVLTKIQQRYSKNVIRVYPKIQNNF